MTRRINQKYHCSALEQLLRQLLFAPPAKRIEQVHQTEKLHDQIDPAQAYPFDFLHYRITGYHCESKDQNLLVGAAILPDLRLIIDSLSRSININVDLDVERDESVQSLAKRLNVSSKTLYRWRQRGLRWRWARNSQSRKKQMVFTRSAVELFLKKNQDQVKRASRFTQIAPDVRKRLIQRAHRIAKRRHISLNQMAVHLANRSHRSLETIRTILEQYDRKNLDNPIFLDRSGPLTNRQNRLIVRAYRMGISIWRIADRFQRSPSTVYRTIHKNRASKFHLMAIHYVESPLFKRDDADEVILRPQPLVEAEQLIAVSNLLVHDLPQTLRPFYSRPILPPARQRSLFLGMNYLKFKAARLRDQLDRYEPRATDLDQIDSLLAKAAAIRDQLVATNLPTVLAVARQHVTDSSNQFTGHLIERLETGDQLLIHEVEQFDAASHQSFQDYLKFKLMRSFANAESSHTT